MAQRACIWSDWPKSDILAKFSHFERFWPVWPNSARNGLVFSVFQKITKKSLKITVFDTFRPPGVTLSRPGLKILCQNPHPWHQFSVRVHMGWTKIPFIIWTFLVPCIYGDPAGTENGVPNRAPTGGPKGVENTPERRGPRTVFARFS